MLVPVVLAAAAVAAPGQTAPTGRMPPALVGAFETFLPLGPGTKPKGRWELGIGARGRAAFVSPYGVGHDAGILTVRGATLVFPPEGGCKGSGSYRFQRSGATLTFVRISDACVGRAFKLTRRPWTRYTDYFPVVIVRR